MSEIFPAIHLLTRQLVIEPPGPWVQFLLLHDFKVHFFHIDPLIELWREFGLLEQLGINATSHDCSS